MTARPIPDEPPWIERAACRDHPYPDDWYDGGEHYPNSGYPATTRRAVAFCHTCPVMAECATYAIEHREVWGVWGGLTPHQRFLMRRKERKPA